LAGSTNGALEVLVYHHLFAALCEEMGASLLRAAFSANIKERRDFSCALFDGSGQMVAQAAHLPVHLGSTPMSVRAAMELGPFADGDTVILNDPYAGGTHLPDITLVTPVFLGAKTPQFFVANRAHHADVGGTHPGSMGPSNDIHGEGIRIPPTWLARGGELDQRLLALLLANMRQSEERQGDLLAQWSANRVGARRLAALQADQKRMAHGASANEPTLGAQAQALIDWTRALSSGFKAKLKRGLKQTGPVTFADELDFAGVTHPVVCTLSVQGARLVFDFRATADAVAGPVNAPRAVTMSAVFYVVRLFLPEDTPTNDGVMDQVEVLTRPGSLVDAAYPSAVAAGNVETSQRLVDVILGALSLVLPEGAAVFALRDPRRRRGRERAWRRRPRRANPHDEHAQHADRSLGNHDAGARDRVHAAAWFRRRGPGGRRRRAGAPLAFFEALPRGLGRPARPQRAVWPGRRRARAARRRDLADRQERRAPAFARRGGAARGPRG
jgi:N-methylhydantoinase B